MAGLVPAIHALLPPPYPPPHTGEGREGEAWMPATSAGMTAFQRYREDNMPIRHHSIRHALLAATMLASPAVAADVTPERLVNADKEPQNWLMNHRTYDGQRFSPLTRINRDNVKNLKLAYAVPLGGAAGDEWVEATPLVENGFIYVTDSWGVLYKI